MLDVFIPRLVMDDQISCFYERSFPIIVKFIAQLPLSQRDGREKAVYQLGPDWVPQVAALVWTEEA